MSNFSLQISFLMLEPHSLKQRLLVLLQVLTPAKPPVTNRSQSTPCKIRNREIYHKNCQQYIYNTKIPTTETQPPRELTANWRKQRENGPPPPRQFCRAVPATAEPERKENPYSPAAHTTEVPKQNCTGPPLHTEERYAREIYT
jgi:hypothetical protein